MRALARPATKKKNRYDAFFDGEAVYMALEFMDSGTLADTIKVRCPSSVGNKWQTTVVSHQLVPEQSRLYKVVYGVGSVLAQGKARSSSDKVVLATKKMLAQRCVDAKPVPSTWHCGW